MNARGIPPAAWQATRSVILGGGGTYPGGGGVPTLVGGGTYPGWGGSYPAGGVPTLVGGTYPGPMVTLAIGRYPHPGHR